MPYYINYKSKTERSQCAHGKTDQEQEWFTEKEIQQLRAKGPLIRRETAIKATIKSFHLQPQFLKKFFFQ